jgi:hypothetical protein
MKAPDPRRAFNRYRRRHERDRKVMGNVTALCTIATLILGGWLLDGDHYVATAAAFAVSFALMYAVGVHLMHETPYWDDLLADEEHEAGRTAERSDGT